MVAAVAVLLLLSLFNNSALDLNIEPETAIIVDFINEEVIEDTAQPEIIDEELGATPVVEESSTGVSDSWESFNEEDIEAELGDLQTGFDLLNNPLQ